jgi:CRP-like cAMP-binding protein
MSDQIVPDFFQLVEGLEAVARIKIDTAHTTLRLNAGDVVYNEGTPADSVYIIAAGVVEATTQSPDRKQSRSIAYMKRGSCFGEIGVLTGAPRLAAVRACQATKLFRFEKEKFLHLLRTIPEFGDYFSRSLALRLHATSAEAQQAIYSLDLSGNLQRFDLLTIFQAITGMHHSGELKLHNSAHELIGSFSFRDGRVEQARFAHLVGLEAVWQGFIQSATEGAFTFRVGNEEAPPAEGDHRIEMESTGLLIEGVSKRDAYQAMPETLRAMEGRLSRKASELEWSDPETAPAAEAIWELIERRPQPLESLWRRFNYSELTFLEAVRALLDLGRAELSPERPTTLVPL